MQSTVLPRKLPTTSQTQEENKNITNELICNCISSLDPVMYTVAKEIANIQQYGFRQIKISDLNSIYQYFLNVLSTISGKNVITQLDILREANRLLVDTHLSKIHLQKLEHLSHIFTPCAKEFNMIRSAYIIHKFFIIDETIVVIFDVVDTRQFRYQNLEQLQELLKPLIDELKVYIS